MPKFLELDVFALEVGRVRKRNEMYAVWLTLAVGRGRNVLWNM